MKMTNIEQFAGFSQFESVKEFNNHIEMWMVDYKEEFSKGERIALKRLVRFAAKVPGVSNAKIGTILKAIHEELGENAISRSTFKRCILKAKAVGLLTVHETEPKTAPNPATCTSLIVTLFLNHPKSN